MCTIAVIGGGPAGVSAIYQLTQYLKNRLQELQAKNVKPKILLIEKKGKDIGPGLAYAKDANDVYLLNLPSSQMSPIPNEADHFVKWLKDYRRNYPESWIKEFPNLRPETTQYLPRKLFGFYLADLAATTKDIASLYGIDIEFIHDEAIDIVANANQLAISLQESKDIIAVDSIVLCIGHLPPSSYRKFASVAGYYETPWDIKEGEIPIDQDVIVAGTRLTAIDAILERAEYINKRLGGGYRGYVGRIIAVSSHGLLPRVISKVEKYYRRELTLETIQQATCSGTQAISLEKLINLFEAEIKQAYGTLQPDKKIAKFDIDEAIKKDQARSPVKILEHEIQCAKNNIVRPWQVVLYSLYPFVPQLWRALNDEGKQEFMEKYYSYWMTYLAAFPASSAEKILELLKNGWLTIYSGLEKEEFVSYNENSSLFKIELPNLKAQLEIQKQDVKDLEAEYTDKMTKITNQIQELTKVKLQLQDLIANAENEIPEYEGLSLKIKQKGLENVAVEFKNNMQLLRVFVGFVGERLKVKDTKKDFEGQILLLKNKINELQLRMQQLNNLNQLQAKYFINATGQGQDIEKSNSKLLENLIKRGLIKPHPFGGIDVDFTSLQVRGESNVPLFVVGDCTRGACMATADLNQIVQNQIPRVINSLMAPLFSLTESPGVTQLLLKNSTVLANVTKESAHCALGTGKSLPFLIKNSKFYPDETRSRSNSF
jgi:uncharacterized NAD(P)/FAD-binding protein YdhS